MRLNWMDPENGSLFWVFVFAVVSLKKIRLNGRLQVVVSSIFFSLFFPSLHSLPPLSFLLFYLFLLSFFLKIKCVLRYFSGSEWAVKMMGNIMVTIWIFFFFFFTFRMLDVLVEQGLVFMCLEAAGVKNILTEASTVGGRVVFEFCYIYAVIF